MNKKLSDLVAIIENWLQNEYNNAPDKEYLSFHLLKQYDILNQLKVYDIGIFNSCSKIYDNYRLGKFDKAIDEFEFYLEKTINAQIKPIIQKNKKSFTPPPQLKDKKSKHLSKDELEIEEGLFEQLCNFIKYSEAERIIKLKYNNHYIQYKNKLLKKDEPFEVESYVNSLIPIDVTIKHFKVLKCKNERNNGKKWLTEDDFNKFIMKAFKGGKGLEKLTLNVGKGEKGLIVDRFHSYYTLAVNHYNENSRNSDLYIRYLTDNFTNYTFEEVCTNFRAKNNSNNGWAKYEIR